MGAAEPKTPGDERPLSDRLRPARLSEVVGNPRVLARFLEWGRSWATGTAPPRFRAAVLAGPPGVGKTTSALALAAEFGWTVVEMNASDARNQGAIDQVAGRAAITHTLGDSGKFRSPKDGGRTLILLDEADCLTGRATEDAARKPSPLSLRDFLRGRYGSVEALNRGWHLGETGRAAAFGAWSDVPTSAGRAAFTKLAEAQADIADWRGSSKSSDTSDRGGLGAIARLVRETRQPLVLTVNDERTLTRYSPVFRSGVVRLPFERLSDRDMLAFVRRIALAQSFAVSPKALEAIVRRSRGDLRAATNDLEAIAPLPVGPLQESVLGARDVGGEVGELAEEVLATPRFYRSVELRNRVDATPDDLLPWFEENAVRIRPDLRGALHRDRRHRPGRATPGPCPSVSGVRAVELCDRADDRRNGGRPRGGRRSPDRLGEISRISRRDGALGIGPGAPRLGPHQSRSPPPPLASERGGVDPAVPGSGVLGGRGPRRAGVRPPPRIVHDLELTPEEVGYLAQVEPDAEGDPGPVSAASRGPCRTRIGGSCGTRADPPPAPAPEARKRVQRSLGEF